MLTNPDHSKIRQYLLGGLSEEEQDRLEERLITEDDLFQELEISKDEVVAEYCAGELAETEREWLQQHYLASVEGRERQAFAMALRRVEVPAPTSRYTWFPQLTGFWGRRSWAFAGATAIVLMVIAGVLFIPRNSGETSLAVTLTSSLGQRGTTDPKIERVKPGPGVGELKISLILSASETSGEGTYRAELDNGVNKKTVTSSRRDANSVVVQLRTSEVPAGFYVLRLFVTPPNGIEQQLPGDYRFIIE